MRKILALAQKELSSYFNSPIAYVILMIIFCTFNIFFYVIVDENAEATLRDIFRIMEFMFISIMPVLTMRLWAEERQSGTIEFLKTTPTTTTMLILGKYAGIMIFMTLIIFISGIYFVILEMFASPDRNAAFCGYFGIFLETALFAAVGLMCSTWTKNQIVAALSAYFILLILYFAGAFEKYFPVLVQSAIHEMSLLNHSTNIFSGLIVSSDLIYFVSGIVFSLFVAKKFAESF